MDRRLHGNADGPRYQAVKKIYESARMDPDRAIKELLGAINYTAAAIILLKEKLQAEESRHSCLEQNKWMPISKECSISQKKEPKTAAESKSENQASDMDDLFDENFGNDEMKASRTNIGE